MDEALRMNRELSHTMVTFGRRLEVLELTMQDDGTEPAIAMRNIIRSIRLENSRAIKRHSMGLSSNESFRETDTQFSALADVWHIESMKPMYTTALTNFTSSSAHCLSWKDRPEVLKALTNHNVNVMGNDSKSYVTVLAYPSVVKDHIFGLQNILEKYRRDAEKGGLSLLADIETVLRRFKHFTIWLDNALSHEPHIGSPKADMEITNIPAQLSNLASLLVVRFGTFDLPAHDDRDAERADTFLTTTHIIMRLHYTGNRNAKDWEEARLENITYEFGEDDRIMTLYGMNFRKHLEADSADTVRDWMKAISELQEALERGSSDD